MKTGVKNEIYLEHLTAILESVIIFMLHNN